MNDKSNLEKSASDWYDEGIEQLRSDSLTKALNCFEKVVELDPNNATGWFQLGYSQAQLGRTEESIESYKKAIDLNPQDHEAWYNLGKQYQDELEEYQEAIECYKKAIAIKPTFSYAWNNMGLAFDRSDQINESIECYEKSVELDPTNQRAWINLAISLYFKGEYLRSLNCYKNAMEIEPLWYDANMSLQAALASIKAKKNLTAQNKDLWQLMGNIYLNLNLFRECILIQRQLIELDVSDFDTWHELGRAYMGLKDHMKFLECFESREEFFRNLKRVLIVTTDKGPLEPDLFWLLENEKTILIIPSEGPDSNFLSKVQDLPDFDNEMVIKAMTSTQDQIFTCWQGI